MGLVDWPVFASYISIRFHRSEEYNFAVNTSVISPVAKKSELRRATKIWQHECDLG